MEFFCNIIAFKIWKAFICRQRHHMNALVPLKILISLSWVVLSLRLLSFDTTPQLWLLFGKTKFEQKLNKQFGAYFYYPQFGAELLALQGKPVTLKGFYIPLETSNSKTLILSKYPMEACFFCGGAGPESVAVVYLSSPPSKRPKLDQIVQVRGILQLNATNVEEMTFILKNAVITS